MFEWRNNGQQFPIVVEPYLNWRNNVSLMAYKVGERYRNTIFCLNPSTPSNFTACLLCEDNHRHLVENTRLTEGTARYIGIEGIEGLGELRHPIERWLVYESAIALCQLQNIPCDEQFISAATECTHKIRAIIDLGEIRCKMCGRQKKDWEISSERQVRILSELLARDKISQACADIPYHYRNLCAWRDFLKPMGVISPAAIRHIRDLAIERFDGKSPIFCGPMCWLGEIQKFAQICRGIHFMDQRQKIQERRINKQCRKQMVT